jgi:membrane AbrB-like protein
VPFDAGSSEIVTNEAATDANSNILPWLGVALATFAATIAMGSLGLPTPALFAALLIGITYALIAVRRPLHVPSSGVTTGQALIGVALGAELDASTLRAVASNWFGVSAVTLATLVLSLGVGIAVARLTGISQATGTLGLVAGGASGIVAMADELGADSRLVAFMQYARVLVVVLAAPLVSHILLAHGQAGCRRRKRSEWDSSVTSLSLWAVRSLGRSWRGGSASPRERCCARSRSRRSSP